MYSGSCLCGKVKYTLLSEPKKVSHCHCTMCQKHHGAAFATYASLPKIDLIYESGASVLKTYCSSENINRKFCGECGSSIEWSGSKEYPDWASIAIATLDTPYYPDKISHIFTSTRVCWLDSIELDGLKKSDS